MVERILSPNEIILLQLIPVIDKLTFAQLFATLLNSIPESNIQFQFMAETFQPNYNFFTFYFIKFAQLKCICNHLGSIHWTIIEHGLVFIQFNFNFAVIGNGIFWNATYKLQ